MQIFSVEIRWYYDVEHSAQSLGSFPVGESSKTFFFVVKLSLYT